MTGCHPARPVASVSLTACRQSVAAVRPSQFQEVERSRSDAGNEPEARRSASHRSGPQPSAVCRVRLGLAVRSPRGPRVRAGVHRQAGPRPPGGALTAAGIPAERIYLDKKSGATTDRPGLRLVLGYARDGDVIVVHTPGPAGPHRPGHAEPDPRAGRTRCRGP